MNKYIKLQANNISTNFQYSVETLLDILSYNNIDEEHIWRRVET
jgi:hypothetical protein